MMVRSRTDLPPPERADKAEDFAPPDVQRKVVENDAFAEADDEVAAHGSPVVGVRAHHRHIPIEAKKIAKTPSSTITRKMDLTTDVVV